MRRVVLYTLMSLDGGVDRPGRYFPHPDPDHEGPPFFDDTMARLEAETIGRQDAVLLNPGASNPAAAAFLAYLRGDAARAILRAAGYEL